MLQVHMREAGLLAPEAKKLPVKRGEEPGFHFGDIAQLVAFGGPDAKGLLGEITGIRLIADQAEREAIKRLVILGHQMFEFNACHKETLILGVGRTSNVPGNSLSEAKGGDLAAFPRVRLP